jgi:hypothetical protein
MCTARHGLLQTPSLVQQQAPVLVNTHLLIQARHHLHRPVDTCHTRLAALRGRPSCCSCCRGHAASVCTASSCGGCARCSCHQLCRRRLQLQLYQVAPRAQHHPGHHRPGCWLHRQLLLGWRWGHGRACCAGTRCTCWPLAAWGRTLCSSRGWRWCCCCRRGCRWCCCCRRGCCGGRGSSRPRGWLGGWVCRPRLHACCCQQWVRVRPARLLGSRQVQHLQPVTQLRLAEESSQAEAHGAGGAHQEPAAHATHRRQRSASTCTTSMVCCS